ncbi:MAG: DMT family transporter [Pirellulaceae bacterium]
MNDSGRSHERPSSTASQAFTGRTLVLLAAVLWSTSGVFAKSPSLQGWDGLTMAYWRAVFAAIVLTPLIRRPKFTWAMVPMVMSFVMMNWTFLTAMTLCEAAAAIWLQQIAPVWVFLGSVLWFGESARRGDWWMLVLGMTGVLVILCYELTHSTSGVFGVACGLAGGVTYAGVILSIRRLREHDACWLIALNHWATVLLLAPFVFLPALHGDGPVWPTGTQWFYLAGMGVFQMGLPYVIFAQGLKRIPGHEASGIALLEPILVPLWVFLARHNHETYSPPTWTTFLGGAVILAGLLIRYIPRSEPAGERA